MDIIGISHWTEGNFPFKVGDVVRLKAEPRKVWRIVRMRFSIMETYSLVEMERPFLGGVVKDAWSPAKAVEDLEVGGDAEWVAARVEGTNA